MKSNPIVDDIQLINGCLMASVTHNGAIPSIEKNVLKVKLRCGVEIEVKNFIGNKPLQELLKASKDN